MSVLLTIVNVMLVFWMSSTPVDVVVSVVIFCVLSTVAGYYPI